jgi:arylsulfatase
MGFRTPILFSWPGTIPRGRVLNELVSTVDVFATLVDFAGLEPPADRSGRSLRPLVTGEGGFGRTRVIGSATRLRPPPGLQASGGAGVTRPERAYFLRSDAWRYLWYRDSDEYPDRNAEELYRIDADPMETRDVAAEHPERTARFREEILAWIEEMKQPSP